MRHNQWAWLAIIAAFMLPCIACADDAAEAQAIRDFKSVRVMVWCVDQQTGKTAGFSDTQLLPGRTVSVEPAAGYRLTFTAGVCKQILNTDFVREWSRSVIPFTVTHGGGSSEATQYLTEPDIHVEYDKEKPVNSVLISVAEGSMRSPALAKLLDQKINGETGELEDLLIAMAQDEQLRPQSLMDAYLVLKTSQRLPQWLAMSRDEDRKGSFPALVAAARLGDAESVKRFCEKCLQSGGNARVRLADLLSDMPANEKFLDTMLQLTTLPDPLLIKMPAGVGVAGMDRRFSLCLPIAYGYPKELVDARARQVVQSAGPQDKARVEQRMAEVLKQIDQLRSPPPATNSTLTERMRLRREREETGRPAVTP